MDNPSNAELDMIEALLATMQQNPGQLYDEVDDEDDDDYDEDDDEDDDEDGYYGDHNIHTLLNPYGGDGGAAMGVDSEAMGGDSGATMQISNAQTMNFLQGLLNMNNGMVDIESAVAAGEGMDGGASSGSFLPSMQSLIPNMDPQMAGALAGAFAGGMSSLMEYNSQDHHSNDDDYDDDDDEDEDGDDDDILSDDEDEEEDEDDDEVNDIHMTHSHPHPQQHQVDPSALALGGIGGLMAAGLLTSGGGDHRNMDRLNSLPRSNDPRLRNYHESMSAPSLMALASSGFVGVPGARMKPNASTLPVNSLAAALPMNSVSSAMALNSVSSALPINPVSSLPILPVASNPSYSSNLATSPPPIGLCAPNPIPVSAEKPSVSVTTTSISNMSGGTVSKANPLAALATGIAGAAFGATVLSPIVNNIVGNSGGTTVVNTKLNSSDGSSTTVIGSDSFNSSNQTISGSEVVDGVATALAATKINSQNTQNIISNQHQPASTPSTKPQNFKAKIEKDIEDDKASLGSGSARSEASGGGKSDTESVGKKTPSPIPEGNESRGRQASSCASIPDLASATESMRDSDTDNHSEAHNVTANLSDLDSDIHDQKSIQQNQYAVGPLPVVVERSTYGWSSMIGLDRAKEALKSLFLARSFPEVFEGTEGSCKGILLFGPSGSGKTCLARALAKEANNALFVGISSRFLLTHNPFDAIKLVRCMFDQARHEKPAVILFDEIEALCYHPYNESAIRAKDEILAQVRGLSTLPPAYPPRQDPSSINDGILVLGTTNQPWLIEDRLRRVFAYNIHVKLPSEKPRHELFRLFLQNLAHNVTDDEFACLISKSDGYSAADINTVIRQASHRVPLQPRNDTSTRMLTFDDVASVMTQYRCRFDEELRKKYDSYIKMATHKTETEDGKESKKDKPKGVKRISHRIAKSLAAAVLAVID